MYIYKRELAFRQDKRKYLIKYCIRECLFEIAYDSQKFQTNTRF